MVKKENLWFSVDIYLKNPSKAREFILDFLGPLYFDVEGELNREYDVVETWHFLWEPHLLFRAKFTNKTGKEDFEDLLVQEKFKIGGDYVEKYVIDENYNGEEKLYGKNGWPIIEKILQAGSEAALEIMRDEKLWKQREFYLSRYWHLFYHQLFPAEHPIQWLKEVIKYVDMARGYLGNVEKVYGEKK